MARINIEEVWWSDLRRSKLAKLLGSEDLADAAAIRMWRLAQDFWKDGRRLVPDHIWEHFEYGQKCIEAGLATVDQSFVYVRGSSQHLEWAATQRENSQKAGKKSAEARKQKNGTAQPMPNKPAKKAKKPERLPNDSRTESNDIEPSGSGSVSVSGSDSVSSSGNFNLLPVEVQKTNGFIAAYLNLFEAKYGVRPHIGGREAGIAKRIFDRMKPDQAFKILQAYFAMPDAWLHKTKHPISALEAKLNEVTVFADSGEFTTSLRVRQNDEMASNALLLQKVRAESV